MKFLNMFLLQFFFVRLTKCRERKVGKFKLTEVSLMENGELSMGGTATYEFFEWYSFQYFVIPFTGWYGDFIFLLNKENNYRITKKVKK